MRQNSRVDATIENVLVLIDFLKVVFFPGWLCHFNPKLNLVMASEWRKNRIYHQFVFLELAFG